MDDRHPVIVKTLRWVNEAATQEFAQALANYLQRQAAVPNLYIALEGDLGVGKTAWVRYVLQALGVRGHIKSPTYAVAESYTVDLGSALELGAALVQTAVWHCDFYRFNDPQEWEDAGFRDIFANTGIKLVEWPDKAQGLLPVADLVLHITLDSDATRLVQLTAQTPSGIAVLEVIVETRA